MSDKQLALLLINLADILDRAIEESKELLPEEAQEKANSLFMNMEIINYPALRPIEDVRTDLRRWAKRLLPEEKPNTGLK